MTRNECCLALCSLANKETLSLPRPIDYMRTGATYLGNARCQIVVWAPLLDQLTLKIVGAESRTVPLRKDDRGYWQAIVEGIEPDARYLYVIGEGIERPDPASHAQPGGVHKASAVVDHRRFEWRDA